MFEVLISLALIAALAGGAYWLWKKRQAKTGGETQRPGGPGEER